MSESTPENTRAGGQGTAGAKTAENSENVVAENQNRAGNTSTPALSPPDTSDEIDTLYCVNHPTVETLLRCNRCGRPICLKCAELTDVGYRCKECIRGVQDKYFTALPTDNIIAFGVAMGVTTFVVPVFGFLFLLFRGLWFIGIIVAFLLGGAAGGILAQIIRTAIGKRRGRYMRYYALGGVAVGVIVGSLIGAAVLSTSPVVMLVNIPLLVFTFLAAATANRLLR